MAWRFGNYHWVKEGMLDNRISGKTTGRISLATLDEVLLDLHGDMDGELRGKSVEFSNPAYDENFVFDHGPHKSTASEYLTDFAVVQRGEVGDILLNPYFYLEWYSEANDRCVIELPRDCCRVFTKVADSGGKGSAVPIKGDHPFRFKVITHSDGIRSPISGLSDQV